MTSVGLRELRQAASEVVRRVEAGEIVDVTVSGRLVARMVPARDTRWLPWSEVADCFVGPADPAWDHDRDLIHQSLRDPWDVTPTDVA